MASPESCVRLEFDEPSPWKTTRYLTVAEAQSVLDAMLDAEEKKRALARKRIREANRRQYGPERHKYKTMKGY